MKKTRVRAAGVVLDEIDYLRLVQARGRVDAAMLSGQRVIMEAEAKVKAASAEFARVLGSLAKTYKFDATKNHQMDDDTHRLIPE